MLAMNFIMVFRCVREVDPLVFVRKDKILEYRTVGKGNGAAEIFGCRYWVGWNPMDGFTRGGGSARAGRGGLLNRYTCFLLAANKFYCTAR